jgi:putative ABC transport system permease protein
MQHREPRGWYRLALLIYPRQFRRRFAAEMTELAERRMARARELGAVRVLLQAAALCTDLARTAPAQWWLAARQRTPGDALLGQSNPRDNMDIIRQDLRVAVRGLMRRPAFTIVAALTLALGIGANTAIFSVVNAVLIRGLPYTDPDQLTLIWGTQGTQGGQGVVYADYIDWRAQTHAFSEMGVMRGQSVNLTGGETADRLIGQFVSASFLRVIGARMAQGRAFTDAETKLATTTPVAIVSYEAWRSHFGANPNMLGSRVVVNGTTLTIVGITVPNMPVPLGAPDIMLPIGYYPNAHGLDRGTRGVLVAARLAPGVTIAAAQRDLSAIAKRLEAAYPATNAGTGAEVTSLREQLVGPTRERLLIILAAVAVVLLIACANVANLQLARGAGRIRELSLRAALGADRRRVAQLLLTESILLSIVGGALGLALAVVMTKGLVALIGPQLPVDAADIRLDWPVLAFALAVSVSTGILFGLPPAWKASRTDLTDMLRTRVGGGLAHVATRNTLVVVQLALSMALLASAGLLTRSLMALQRVDPGFDASHLLTAQFRLAAGKYDSPEKIWVMFARTLTELRALPGVESAALVRASPLSGNGESYGIEVEGKPAAKVGDAPQMQLNSITPGYFSTMRIPMLAGRGIADADRAGAAPVIVVNKTFADKTWPNASPIGRRVRISDDDWRTVIGVAGDTKQYTLNEIQLSQGYIPHAQRPQIFTSLVVRAKGNPLDLVKSVRDAIWRVDRDQPVWRFRSMDQDLDAVVTSRKTMMWLTALFAIVALVVAAVGVYGVLSYTMAQRTQEVGIRIALGAEGRQVVRMVVGEGMRLVGIAIGIGLVVSAAATRLLRSQLFGVGTADVLTFSVVTLVLAAVAIAACYLPARRASRVDPMVALRTD